VHGSNLHVGSGARVPVRTKPAVGGACTQKNPSLFYTTTHAPAHRGSSCDGRPPKGIQNKPKKRTKKSKKGQQATPPLCGALLSLVPRVQRATGCLPFPPG
jgi:hypothetical protein